MKKLRNLLVLITAVFMVTVLLPENADAATSLKLDKKTMTIYAGGSATLKATGVKKGIKWSSSKKAVATVSQKGVVTAKKPGKTVITAKAGNKKAKCTVTVKKRLTAKQTVSKINSQLKKTQNITMKLYVGSVKKSNYIAGIAMGVKSKVAYMESPTLGMPKMYMKGNKVYWYDTASKKWYYYKESDSGFDVTDIDENVIDSKMKYKDAGLKTFNGIKCAALQVVYDGETSIYYVDLKDYSLVGITSGKGSEKEIVLIDLKTKVSIPSAIVKNAKYKEYVIK